MSLGFAAATIFAAQAQEVITEEPTEDAAMQTEEMSDDQVDEMQEEVREMQGSPADPQRDSDMETQANTKEIGEEGGVKSITQAELPEEVMQGLQDSEFAQATVEEVYLMEDQAIDKLMEADAEQMYIGDQLPDKLYQLRVNSEDEKSLLYFDETGELLGSKSM